MKSILIVEDDLVISSALAERFRHENFNAIVAGDGISAVEFVNKSEFDAVVLDLMLNGDLNGLDVLARIRSKIKGPIIVLTARNLADEKEKALDELHADEYLVKPCKPSLIVSRIREHSKSRVALGLMESINNVEFGPLFVDSEKHKVYKLENKEQVIELTTTEFTLLKTILNRPDHVFSRAELLKIVWNWESSDSASRTVDTHIKSLRKKIGNYKGEEYIKTVHGLGYGANEVILKL